MSLRRSVRNAEKVKMSVPEVAEALYEKSSSNGASKKITTASKKTAVLRKAVAAKKRKTSEPTSSIPDRDAHSSDIKAEEDTPATDIDITKPLEVFAAPAEPSTPLPAKRRRKADTVSPAKSIPFTPTPSGIGLMIGSSKAAKKDADHMLDDLASLNRPASPHLTNAPVLTPSGSQVVVPNGDSPAKKRKAKELPPDVGSPLKAASSTIDTMLKDAEEFLINADPRLRKVVQGHQCKIFTPEGLREVVDPFTALSSGIIGQQVCLPLHYISHSEHFARQSSPQHSSIFDRTTDSPTHLPLTSPLRYQAKPPPQSARNSPPFFPPHILHSPPPLKSLPSTSPRSVPRASPSARPST
jgi:DNA-3-methyladenine glycosylase II